MISLARRFSPYRRRSMAMAVGSNWVSEFRCKFWKLSKRFKAAFDRMSTELIEKVDTAQ